MKYLKQFESLAPLQYVYDREYIEECFVDIEWHLIEANLDYFEIYIPSNDIEAAEYSIEKVKVRYPDVKSDISDLTPADEFFLYVSFDFAECIDSNYMKYLKHNEAKTQAEMQTQFIEEVEQFSQEALAYLIDLGCTVRFTHLPFNMGIVLKFKPSMSWDSIEQYVLPFYEILRETYYLDKEGIVEIKFESGSGDFDIDNGELMDYRTVVMNDETIKEPLDSLIEIKIKFDNKRVYGKFDYERFKK